MRSRRVIAIFGLILLLGGASFAFSHPQRQNGGSATKLATTPKERDELRHKSLEALAEAIRASTRLHNGVYPFAVPHAETGICSGVPATCKKARLVDLAQVISDGTIAAIPSDPLGGSGQYASGYSLRRNADGSIVLIAPRTELGENIQVKL